MPGIPALWIGRLVMERLPWIAAVLALSLLAVVVIVGIWMLRRPKRLPPLPTEWSLSARPVFSTDERRVYKLLREALPHHIVLSKLPLVRFSQPSDPSEVRFWYDLLGACRIRYLRCPVDNLPTAAELQLLVPSSTAATARGPQPGIVPPRDIDEARDSLASTVATRRAQSSALWQDSSVFQDSFFAPDSRTDTLNNSDFASLSFANPRTSPARDGNGHDSSSDGIGRNGAVPYESRRAVDEGDEPAGVVVDAPALPLTSRSHH